MTPSMRGLGGLGTGKSEQWGLQTNLRYLPSDRHELQFYGLPSEFDFRGVWETNTHLR